LVWRNSKCKVESNKFFFVRYTDRYPYI
jgi:hypothetical protein